jgi:transcriptional regulator with XRE-family HTH domain
MKIGSFLHDRRAEAGVTQVDLAARSGLSQSMVSAVEAGRRQPSLPTVERMLACLGLQLKIDAEPLETDPDDLIDECPAASPERPLDRPGLAASALLSKLAPLRPVVDGLAAAALQGVPVLVSRLDVAVAAPPPGLLEDVLVRRMFAERWLERWREWIFGDPERPWPSESRWRTVDGEFTVRVVDPPLPRITVVVGGTPVEVRPLADVEADDDQARRAIARARERRLGRPR